MKISLNQYKILNTMDKKGVIFIVTNSKKHIDQCLFSAKSLLKTNPELPITLFTDTDGIEDVGFDNIILIKEKIHPLKLKVKNLINSPYNLTLFLDSDTKIEGNILNLFNYLRVCDFVITRDPLMDWSKSPPEFLDFSNKNAYNTGVFLYKKSQKVNKFLLKWYELIENQDEKIMHPGHFCDQQYFNKHLIKRRYHDLFDLKICEFDNKIFNTRIYAYERLRPPEQKKVLVKHWHGLNNGEIEY